MLVRKRNFLLTLVGLLGAEATAVQGLGVTKWRTKPKPWQVGDCVYLPNYLARTSGIELSCAAAHGGFV